jgi:hypothetical protein
MERSDRLFTSVAESSTGGIVNNAGIPTYIQLENARFRVFPKSLRFCHRCLLTKHGPQWKENPCMETTEVGHGFYSRIYRAALMIRSPTYRKDCISSDFYLVLQQTSRTCLASVRVPYLIDHLVTYGAVHNFSTRTRHGSARISGIKK